MKTSAHPGSHSDTHPPEKALHEAISVHGDSNILVCLCPTLCILITQNKTNRAWVPFCTTRVIYLPRVVHLKARGDTYISQFSQSILHHTGQLVSWPDTPSQTPAGSPRQPPLVTRGPPRCGPRPRWSTCGGLSREARRACVNSVIGTVWMGRGRVGFQS